MRKPNLTLPPAVESSIADGQYSILIDGLFIKVSMDDPDAMQRLINWLESAALRYRQLINAEYYSPDVEEVVRESIADLTGRARFLSGYLNG